MGEVFVNRKVYHSKSYFSSVERMEDYSGSEDNSEARKIRNLKRSTAVDKELENEARRNIAKKEVPKNLMLRSASTAKITNTDPTLASDADLKEFDYVLNEPILCAGFRKYLQQIFSEENLDFWKAVELFKTIKSPKRRQQEAQKIFDEYISDKSGDEEPAGMFGDISGGSARVNVPETYIISLEQHLNDKKGVPVDLFDHIQLEIYHAMKKDTFRQFVLKPAFAECKDVFYSVRRLNETPEDEDQRNGLTDRDWRFLLTGAKDINIEPGTQIITMNKSPTSMYRLKSGSLRVFKPSEDGEETTICVIDKPGSVVGELSVLGNYGFATASVSCHTPCVLHQIELPFINKLFDREAELARRFYISVGKNLGTLLTEISAITAIKVSDDTPREGPSSAEEEVKLQETQFHELFKTPDEELLICTVKCSYDKVIVRKGTLYVSQQGVYFYSRIFSQKTKERIPFSSIKSIDYKERGKVQCSLRIDCGRKKHTFIMKAEAGLKLQGLINDLKEVASDEVVKPVSPVLERASQDSDEVMSSSDWDILLSGGIGATQKHNSRALMTFSKGDVILEEGKKYMMVCQIASGSCRIEENIPDSNMSAVLGVMSEGEVFGEINFMTGRAATASVVAATRVEMYVIGPSVKTVFSRHPGVVNRFYHYLCASLAKRIVQRESEGWGRSVVN